MRAVWLTAETAELLQSQGAAAEKKALKRQTEQGGESILSRRCVSVLG